MNDKLIPIGDAANILGVTPTTLRRWDKAGTFPAIKTPSGRRYYSSVQISLYKNDLFLLARKWVSAQPKLPSLDFYCSNQAVFQTRLMKMEQLLLVHQESRQWFSLLVAATGEMGNNSFDHNIGNWPDIAGIFYAYDLSKNEIILADRGRGILSTLQRVKPELTNNEDALRVAFTEIISGRAPEARGNGLKYVKLITESYPVSLTFQSGDARVILEQGKAMNIERTIDSISGCLMKLTYK